MVVRDGRMEPNNRRLILVFFFCSRVLFGGLYMGIDDDDGRLDPRGV